MWGAQARFAPLLHNMRPITASLPPSALQQKNDNRLTEVGEEVGLNRWWCGREGVLSISTLGYYNPGGGRRVRHAVTPCTTMETW